MLCIRDDLDRQKASIKRQHRRTQWGATEP